MRKAIAFVALTVAVLGFSSSLAASRTCDDHGGVTRETGFNVGTMQDQGRDSLDVCSDSGAPTDAAVRAGYASRGSAYVAVDGNSDANDGYVYLNADRETPGVYCGTAGNYDSPNGRDPQMDGRDVGRTDRCAP